MHGNLDSKRAVRALIVASLALVAATFGVGAATGTHAGGNGMRIMFLHHSTGRVVWDGGVPEWFERYNREHGTDYRIEERDFPQRSPYGWNNYPFDYWNIWVQHAGPQPYREEPTLEILTAGCDVIVFKHCFPVSDIQPDTGNPDIASECKRLENYRLQYEALKAKLREFPGTKFLVWTAAPRVETTSLRARLAAFVRGRSPQRENAERASEFAAWVREAWDEPGDNIFVWDFHALATGGGLFLKPEYAAAPGDSHPNAAFARDAAEAFCRRLVDVVEGRGDEGGATGAARGESR